MSSRTKKKPMSRRLFLRGAGTVALGLPELRARIARHYGEWYGVDLDPARVVVTSGASGGVLSTTTESEDSASPSSELSAGVTST